MSATTPPLPSWPERLKFPLDTPYSQDIEAAYLHERARADAAMARLRVAVEALEQAKADIKADVYAGDIISDINLYLLAIGALPPQQQRTGDV